MGIEAPPPPAPAPQSPSRDPRRTRRLLEVALFVLVFGAGTVLAAIAATSGPKTSAVTQDRSGPPSTIPRATSSISEPFTPIPTPTSVVPVVPSAPSEDKVIFVNGSSDSRINGCTAELIYTWELAPRNAPPSGSTVVIGLFGPEKDGQYTTKVVGRKVEFRIEVPLGTTAPPQTWIADPVSVGGTPAEHYLLPLKFTFPQC